MAQADETLEGGEAGEQPSSQSQGEAGEFVATQPINEANLDDGDDQRVVEVPMPENAFGWLVSFLVGLPMKNPIVLEASDHVMSVGRLKCKTTGFKGLDHYHTQLPSTTRATSELSRVTNFTSRIHFLLKRDYFPGRGVAVTMIADTSMNGTFVKTDGADDNDWHRLEPPTVTGKGLKVLKWQLLDTDTEIAIGDGTRIGTAIFMYQEKEAPIGPSELNRLYHVLGKPLGKGAFGEVFLGQSRATFNRVAVKVITLKADEQERVNIHKEVEVLKNVAHPACIQFLSSHSDENSMYIVMDCCDGGEFFEYVTHKKFHKRGLRETLSIFYTRQMFLAIDFLHAKGITHRDLKPENILLKTLRDDDYNIIKVNDFGMAKHVHNQTRMKSFVGTPQYIAPEIIMSRRGGSRQNRYYTNKVDVFSLGAIVFIALSGLPPFSNDWPGKVQVEQQILTADDVIPQRIYVNQAQFPHNKKSHWTDISELALDFVRACMKVKATDRLTARQALGHAWFKTPAGVLESDRAWNMLVEEAESAALNLSALHASVDEIAPIKPRKLEAVVASTVSTNMDAMALAAPAVPEHGEDGGGVQNGDAHDDGDDGGASDGVAAADDLGEQPRKRRRL